MIKKEYSVLSLSGPISFYLKELNLLDSPELKAISTFHHIGHSRALKMGGGLFLSKKELMRLKINYLFFDESDELRKKITNLKVKNKIEIKSRGLDPFAVVEAMTPKLEKIITGCEKQIIEIKNKYSALKTKLTKNTWPKCMLYFVGEFVPNKKPGLLMVNDGPVKFLLDNKLTKSYHSSLAYVFWSMKEMKKYSSCVQIGITSYKNRSKCSKKKIGDNQFNIVCPGALTPGSSQIKLLEFLAQSF